MLPKRVFFPLQGVSEHGQNARNSEKNDTPPAWVGFKVQIEPSLRHPGARGCDPAARDHLPQKRVPPPLTMEGQVESGRQLARVPLNANRNQQQPMHQGPNPSALLRGREPDDVERLEHVVRQRRQPIIDPIRRQTRTRRMVQIQVPQHLTEPTLHLPLQMVSLEDRLRRPLLFVRRHKPIRPEQIPFGPSPLHCKNPRSRTPSLPADTATRRIGPSPSPRCVPALPPARSSRPPETPPPSSPAAPSTCCN